MRCVRRRLGAACVFSVFALTFAALSSGCSRSDKLAPYASEIAEREAFAKNVLVDAGASRALGVSSTAEIQFDEGFGILSFDPPGDLLPDGGIAPHLFNHAFRWMGQNATARLKTRGGKAMKLLVAGWAHHGVIQAKPVISAYIDGHYIDSVGPIEAGHYWLETVVPPSVMRREWVDLTLRTNAVGFHWSDVPELNVLNVYRFEWTEAE